MFNFFKRSKPTIHSIVIPNLGWDQVSEEPQVKKWLSPARDTLLSLNFFEEVPDLPSIRDIHVIRAFYRKLVVEAGGGIVEVSLGKIQGIATIKTIFKRPQEPQGMTYVGSFTMPFAEFSYVVKVEAVEAGATGFRDNAVLSQMMAEERVHFDGEIIHGWMADPYDPNFQGGSLMNLSEHEHYDAQFPDHPLSRVRRNLDEVVRGIGFADELRRLREFPR